MEEEKKKKRNKKKKNKQNKATDEESDPNHHAANPQNGDVPASNAHLDLDSHLPNGAPDNSVKEMIKGLPKENESHVQKEALQETIKHLQHENESHVQKEATLEETIKQLRNEIDSHLKKQVSLEETILKLQHGNGSSLQKEETIQQLQYENESHKQKLATLEVNIVELRSEKEFWLQEKVSLEEKISRLLDEKASLDLKGAYLEEKIKQLEKEKESWVLTENSIKETISGLNREIIRLNMQVVELEESSSTLSQENQQLTENASGLQLYIQNLERNMTSGPSSDEVKQASVHEALNSQIEAASALIDKLMMENAELVEKVNELYVKLEQQSTGAGQLSSSFESVPMAKVAETASLPDSTPSTENGSVLAPQLDSHEIAPIHNGKVDENVDGQPVASLPSFVEAEDSGEIVQISLDDSDVRDDSEDLESRATEGEENGVPLSDAPLIGAPFRLISFVANYVSGADLVNKSSSES